MPSLLKRVLLLPEINACATLLEENITGLVRCENVKVNVQHSIGLDVSSGEWSVLKMKRYVTSLAELPQLSEIWLSKGFSRIMRALEAMHNKKIVHMDVKADNLFVDSEAKWDLGDFGSAREIGSPVWSFTEVFHPYIIPRHATVIPAIDYVLLCVTIAVELKKDEWKKLCGDQQKVQENLVLEKLNSIQDPHQFNSRSSI